MRSPSNEALLRRFGAVDVAVFGGLAGAVLLLYGRALRFWWTADDPAILRHVFLYRPGQYFFDREIYQGFSKLFFFPGLLLSFEADLGLFGFRPVLFYLHQLAAVAGCAVLLYVLMRRWLGRSASCAVAFLFLVGPPLSRVVPQLGVRHYVDGLVLALAATLCFLESLERRGWWWSAAAGILALAAMACKEIYAPLPVLLLALAAGAPRDRVRRLIPILAALALYVVWRQFLLGGYIGGYTGESSRPADLWGRVPMLLKGLKNSVLGAGGSGSEAGGIGLAAGIPAVALAAAVLLSRRRSFFLVLLVTLLVLGPLLPVADNFQPRYAFVPWTAAAVGAGWAADAWTRLRRGAAVGTALVLLTAASVLPANRRVWEHVVRLASRSRAEAMFFFHESVPGDVLRLPVEEGSFYRWLGWLRAEVLHGGRPGRAVLDDLFFCRRGREAARVFGFSDASGRMEPVPGGAKAVCEAYGRRVRENAPLFLRLAADGGVFEWEFGPRLEGAYSVLIGDDLVGYDLPRRGRQKPAVPDDTTLTLRYESPEGWLAFSPALPLKLIDGRARVEWSR